MEHIRESGEESEGTSTTGRGRVEHLCIEVTTHVLSFHATAARGAKGQHSAPRGGPPRSWTNDDLTKALENVWNKRMTTSQASRMFSIPYNSLLMYVRGKYGKSLKLDVLKSQTPAANDNLNTIGNSRSTPKDKAALNEKAVVPGVKGIGGAPLLKGKGLSSNVFPPTPPEHPLNQQPTPASLAASAPGLNPLAAFHNLPGFPEHMGGLLGMLPAATDSSRMSDLMQNLQRQQQQLLSNAAQGNSPPGAATPPGSTTDVRPGSGLAGEEPGKVSSSMPGPLAQFAAAVQQHRHLQQLQQRAAEEERRQQEEQQQNEDDDDMANRADDEEAAENEDKEAEAIPREDDDEIQAADAGVEAAANAAPGVSSEEEEEQMEQDDEDSDATAGGVPAPDVAAPSDAFSAVSAPAQPKEISA